jgi:large subunit ribosomal protein L29
MKASELRQKDRRAQQGAGRPAEGAIQPAHAKATQQLTNTSQLKKVRRDIARVQTVLTRRRTRNER